MQSYHYTECGLSNIYVQGITVGSDGTIGIPYIIQLHLSIAKAIIQKPTRLNGEEVRFLRTELGMTQTNLSDCLGVTIKTVQRWEKNQTTIGKLADVFIRLKADESLNLGGKSLHTMITNAKKEDNIPISHTVDITEAVA